MFPEELSEKEAILKNYVANYRINLVDAGHLEKLETFKTDLQEIFGMLRYRQTKTELVHYMNENGDYFRNVDETTYYAIREFLHSDKLWKKEIRLKNGEEQVDMCQALEELYNDGKSEGRLEGYNAGKSEGYSAGIADGEKEKLLKLIRVKLAKGKSVEEIAEALEEEVTEIQQLIQELEKIK